MACSKMSRMTEAFKKEFGACLAKKGLPPNEHFSASCATLKKHNMFYKLKAHPRQFLTHGSNRGGLLISPHNAHKNAADIKKAGADLEMLTNSWCTELPVDGPIRELYISKNAALIERAEGLLAAINGEERFCSVGCGHTVAWCKHADVGGITSEPSLRMQSSNKIDKQTLFENKNFQTMVTEGWEWNVVYAEVDIEFPAWARIAQKALNTRNHVANVIGELEVCMTLAQTMQDPGMTTLSNWKELATENISSLCAPCSSYAGTLLDYIVSFGGGNDACLIQLVDKVSKQFGANVTLGETFWKSLHEAEFADKQCKYPMVRTALMLANLTGDKVEDSVARLLSKADVVKVASKAKMAATLEAEKLLEDAWHLVNAVSSTDACIKPLGQMFVRLGLKLTGLEKKGREGKTYSITELKTLFLKGVSDVVGKSVEFPKWFGEDEQIIEPASEAAKVHAPKMATISDHYDPKFVCSISGFNIGTLVVEKGVETTPESIYAIFTIDDSVVLHQACNFAGLPRKVAVSIDELIKNWTVTKAEPPVLMQSPVPELPIVFKAAMTKNELYAALNGLYFKNKKHLEAVSYFRGPDQIRTKDSTTKAGSLVFVPAVPLTNIVIDSTSRGIDLGEYDGHKFTILPLAKIPNIADAWDPPDAFVNPYFWVAKTNDKKLANMAEDSITFKGLSIPVLKNSADIPPYTKLSMYVKPKAAVVPLSNAVLQTDDDDEDDADAAPGAKAHAKRRPAPKAKQSHSKKARK